MRNMQVGRLALLVVTAVAVLTVLATLSILKQDIVPGLPFLPSLTTMHPLFSTKSGVESLKVSSSIDFGRLNESALPQVCREAENNKNFPG